MKRNIDLNEISDGRLYSSGDMAVSYTHLSQITFSHNWSIQLRKLADSIITEH